MPLFACSKCHTVENTALGEYWKNQSEGKPVLCSECVTGTWHGEFPKEFAFNGWFIQPDGFLCKKDVPYHLGGPTNSNIELKEYKVENVIQAEIQKLEEETIQTAPVVEVVEEQQAFEMPKVLTNEQVQAMMANQKTPSVPMPEMPSASVPREKIKDKIEIAIRYGSELTPGNVVLLGTGDLNKKYRQWLENRFQASLASSGGEKMSKEKIRLQRFTHALCYMAVAEDETKEVTYKWDGPTFYKKHQGLNVCKVVQEFVKDKFDILYSIAPFFHVKINRPSASNQPETKENENA